MVTTDALKLLYKKLGGTADVESITSISDMVDLIEDVAGGGGGASGLVVHGIAEGDTKYLDKTYAEITDSIKNGIMPVFIMNMGVGQDNYPFMVTSAEAEGIYGIGLLNYSVVTGDWTPLTFMANSADGVLTLTQQ